MGVGGQRHASAALSPGKTQYPVCRRLGRPQGWSGWVQKISAPLAFDPRTAQPIGICYTDCAIPAHSETRTFFIFQYVGYVFWHCYGVIRPQLLTSQWKSEAHSCVSICYRCYIYRRLRALDGVLHLYNAMSMHSRILRGCSNLHLFVCEFTEQRHESQQLCFAQVWIVLYITFFLEVLYRANKGSVHSFLAGAQDLLLVHGPDRQCDPPSLLISGYQGSFPG